MAITLNVSGVLMYTKLTTLKQSSYFRTLLDKNKFGDKDPDGSYFIDEDPELFKHILNKLRHPEYVFPKEHEENLAIMANFYQIPSVVHKPEPEAKPENNSPDVIAYKEFSRPWISIEHDRPIQILSFSMDTDNAVIKFYTQKYDQYFEVLCLHTNVSGILNIEKTGYKLSNHALEKTGYKLSNHALEVINKYRFYKVTINNKYGEHIINGRIDYYNK